MPRFTLHDFKPKFSARQQILELALIGTTKNYQRRHQSDLAQASVDYSAQVDVNVRVFCNTANTTVVGSLAITRQRSYDFENRVVCPEALGWRSSPVRVSLYMKGGPRKRDSHGLYQQVGVIPSQLRPDRLGDRCNMVRERQLVIQHDTQWFSRHLGWGVSDEETILDLLAGINKKSSKGLSWIWRPHVHGYMCQRQAETHAETVGSSGGWQI